MNMVSKSVIVSFLLLAFVGKVDAQILGVQFQGGGTALTGTQTAGVVPLSNYNVVTGETGTALSLVDSGGVLTSATLTFSTADMYNTTTGNSTPDTTLISGKIGPSNSTLTASITLNNLTAGNYDLILYTENDNAGQIATFSVGSTGYSIADQAGSTFDGTWIRGTNTDPSMAASHIANYVRFDNVSVAAGGSITILSTQIVPSGVGGGAFNGLELVAATAAPEPSDMALSAVGLIALAGLYRFRKKLQVEN